MASNSNTWAQLLGPGLNLSDLGLSNLDISQADKPSTASKSKGWPNYVVLQFDAKNTALTPPGKTHSEMIDLAMDAFPGLLANISRNQITFSCTIGTAGERARPTIAPPLWSRIVSKFQTGSWVYMDIKKGSKRDELPPLYAEVTPTQEAGVIIFELDLDNAAFVFPGMTVEEGMQVAKAAFPDKLFGIPDSRISFALRGVGGLRRRIMPAVYGVVMSEHTASVAEGLYQTIYVTIAP